MELTQEIAAASGFSIDEKEFTKAQEQAVGLARQGWKGSGAQNVRGKSVVVGLDHAITSDSMTLHQLCGVGERYTLAVDHDDFFRIGDIDEDPLPFLLQLEGFRMSLELDVLNLLHLFQIHDA